MSSANDFGLHDTYTMDCGASFRIFFMILFPMPERGGSKKNVSNVSVVVASHSLTGEQTNEQLATLFSRAFSCANLIDSASDSTPVTWIQWLASTRLSVPTPQKRSATFPETKGVICSSIFPATWALFWKKVLGPARYKRPPIFSVKYPFPMDCTMRPKLVSDKVSFTSQLTEVAILQVFSMIGTMCGSSFAVTKLIIRSSVNWVTLQTI